MTFLDYFNRTFYSVKYCCLCCKKTFFSLNVLTYFAIGEQEPRFDTGWKCTHCGNILWNEYHRYNL